MSDESYNGYTNYETWAVKLWIDNDEASYNYWMERARELDETELRDTLQNELEERNPVQTVSVYTDLMRAALQRVNYQEIARLLKEDREDQTT